MLKIIKEELPIGIKSQLLIDEDVYYFSYITSKGGCLSSSSRDEYWIALTNKRAIYNTKIFENEKTVERNGILPLEKISFIEVSDKKVSSGCSSVQSYNLLISTSGGAINIPIPTKEKGYEIRSAYSEIMESIKKI